LLIRLGFVLRPLSWTRLLLLTLTPACSCVYICKFQFRPIHPPSRRLSVSLGGNFILVLAPLIKFWITTSPYPRGNFHPYPCPVEVKSILYI
jgi:hypothetical protein